MGVDAAGIDFAPAAGTATSARALTCARAFWNSPLPTPPKLGGSYLSSSASIDRPLVTCEPRFNGEIYGWERSSSSAASCTATGLCSRHRGGSVIELERDEVTENSTT